MAHPRSFGFMGFIARHHPPGRSGGPTPGSPVAHGDAMRSLILSILLAGPAFAQDEADDAAEAAAAEAAAEAGETAAEDDAEAAEDDAEPEWSDACTVVCAGLTSRDGVRSSGVITLTCAANQDMNVEVDIALFDAFVGADGNCTDGKDGDTLKFGRNDGDFWFPPSLAARSIGNGTSAQVYAVRPIAP